MAICWGPEVGRDERILGSSHSSFNEVSFRLSGQRSLQRSNWNLGFHKSPFAWAWIHFSWSTRGPYLFILYYYLFIYYCTENTLIIWLMDGGVSLGIWKSPTARRSKSISFAWEDRFSYTSFSGDCFYFCMFLYITFIKTYLWNNKALFWPKTSQQFVTCVWIAFLWKLLYSGLLSFAYWLHNHLAYWKCRWCSLRHDTWTRAAFVGEAAQNKSVLTCSARVWL